MYIQNIFIENMGAIENFQLLKNQLFKENGDPKPIILVGQNGSGKTTVLSSIVDALYELANTAFMDILPDKGGGHLYLKISGSKNIRIGADYAFSYVSFFNGTNRYEYCDRNGVIEQKDLKSKTNNLLSLDMSSSEVNQKKTTDMSTNESFQKDFLKNSYCYFPSDRYELPYWLNEEAVDQKRLFDEKIIYSGQLTKEILVRRSLNEIKSWILDVFLDSRAELIFDDIKQEVVPLLPWSDYRQLKQSIKNIEKILSNIVQKEIEINLNFRESNSSRIKLKDKNTEKDFIPSLDNLSAGQSTLLGIFATIIQYSDRADVNKSINLELIQGIVLIDEIDLHLHIELQHDVLPKLIRLFPKVQFIITTHSPFFLSGLNTHFEHDETLIINMPNGNKINIPDDFSEFERAYEIFNGFTNTYKTEIKKLQEVISQTQKPLIITEGKTDWKHLKAAFQALEYNNLDFELFENEEEWGDSVSKALLDNLKKIPNSKKTIFMFDRDNKKLINDFGDEEYKKISDNLYAFCLPKLSDGLDNISIEYYYFSEDLKKLDKNNRRLFDGREFDSETGISKGDGEFILGKKAKNKAGETVIIDTNVFYTKQAQACGRENKQSVALSKNDFAECILNKQEGFENINFENFEKIFEVIRKIIQD